jgi:hypothetical protein
LAAVREKKRRKKVERRGRTATAAHNGFTILPQAVTKESVGSVGGFRSESKLDLA